MARIKKIPTPAGQELAGDLESTVEQEVAEETINQAQSQSTSAEVRENAKNSPSAKAKKLASKVAKKPVKDLQIKVVAIDKCYYNNTRISAGKKFTIRDMCEFSENCMELIK